MDMQRFIAKQNVDRYLRLLESERDPARRRQIELLLEDEQTKLDALEGPRTQPRKRPPGREALAG